MTITTPCSSDWTGTAFPATLTSGDLTDLLHGQFVVVAKRKQGLVVLAQFFHGISQNFKLEVLEYFIFHRTPDTSLAGQHRFKLTSTQMPGVPPVLCLFPFPISLQKVCDLLWRWY